MLLFCWGDGRPLAQARRPSECGSGCPSAAVLPGWGLDIESSSFCEQRAAAAIQSGIGRIRPPALGEEAGSLKEVNHVRLTIRNILPHSGQEWLTTRRPCYGTSALARLIVAVSGVSPGRVGRD
jgi:hypothetical protein